MRHLFCKKSGIKPSIIGLLSGTLSCRGETSRKTDTRVGNKLAIRVSVCNRRKVGCSALKKLGTFRQYAASGSSHLLSIIAVEELIAKRKETIMLRRSLTVLSILAMLLTFFTVSGSASAASTSSSQIDFASLEKTCALIQVHLNGVQHTVACLRKKTSTHSDIRPNTGTTACSNSAKSFTIWAASATTEICFAGTGYLGYSVNNVNFVNSYVAYGWVLWYPTHQFCNISRGVPAYFGGGSSGVTITQINPGGVYQNAPVCPSY